MPGRMDKDMVSDLDVLRGDGGVIPQVIRNAHKGDSLNRSVHGFYEDAGVGHGSYGPHDMHHAVVGVSGSRKEA